MNYSSPQVGRAGHVSVKDHDLILVEGTYQCVPAERFGEKISIGPLKYSDFNPYESAFSIGDLSGGYGVARYSDVRASGRQSMPLAQFPDETPPFYKETSNVDCREAGLVTLGPSITVEDLPGAAVTATWFGSFKGKFYCLSGVLLFERALAGGWTLKYTFAQAPVAVGVFDGNFIAGFGAAAVGAYSTDLVSWTNLGVYIWAFSSDRAAAYIAGGPANNDYNEILSSADGVTYGGTATVCGSADHPITALAPGGGAYFLFVGKDNELGAIDLDGTYRVLVPIDAESAYNCTPLRWWQGAGGEEARGPMTILFGRERGLWSYSFKDGSGYAQNISPWAMPSVRPTNIKGRITALQGTSKYLYMVVENSGGNSWVLARDVYTGAYHPVLELGAKACRAMGLTTSSTGYPLLYYGYGLDTGCSILPVDGDSPSYDTGCRYSLSGTLYLSDIDFGFPDELKTFYSVRVIADDLVGGQQTIKVEVNFDDSGWVDLGTSATSPSDEIAFPYSTVAKRLSVRLTFATNDAAKTPKLRGLIFRGRINTELKRRWTFQAYFPQGYNAFGSENLADMRTQLDEFWDLQRTGTPFSFLDLFGQEWMVTMRIFGEQHLITEPDRIPQMGGSFELIEIEQGGGNVVWDDPLFIWDSPALLWN